MTKKNKALLALVGVTVIGTILGAALGLDNNSVSFGLFVGVAAEVLYFHIKE